MQPVRRAVRNPFQLMMDPQSVIDAMLGSERLERLQRRICHPLDKPPIVKLDEDKASPRMAKAAT